MKVAMVTVREGWPWEVFHLTKAMGAPFPEETGLSSHDTLSGLSQGQFWELLASWQVLDSQALPASWVSCSQPVPVWA